MKKGNRNLKCIYLCVIFSLVSWVAMAKNYTDSCAMPPLPSIIFKHAAKLLTPERKRLLDLTAKQIKSNPACKVKVMAYGSFSEELQELSWERAAVVVKYLIAKGINKDRFIFSYGNVNGPNDTVDLQGSTEDGPSWLPEPMPHKSHS